MTSAPVRTLALETSSAQLSLAVGDAQSVRDVWVSQQDWRHAESLLLGMETILKKQRWPLDTLTGVAVSVGPGSFTGIRIGISAARALGQFLDIPVVGVSALEVLAYGATGSFMAPVMDALQGHVFAGFYSRFKNRWRRLEPDMRCPQDVWTKKCVAWKKTHGALTVVEGGAAARHYPRADILLTLAQPRLAKAKKNAYKRVLPLYLRDATAIERLKAGAPHNRRPPAVWRVRSDFKAHA